MARLFDDASTEYLTLASAVITAAPFTFACWYYSDTASQTQSLVSLGDASDSNQLFILRLQSNNKIRFRARDSSGGSNADTSTNWNINTWEMASCSVHASNDRRVFRNGGSKGTSTPNRTPTGLDQTRIAAQASTAGSPFSGRIAQVAIWNSALSDADHATLYNSGVAFDMFQMQPAALVCYWKLFQDDGDIDYAGSNDMTAVNTPSYADHVPFMQPLTGWHFERQAAPPAGNNFPFPIYYGMAAGGATSV